MLYLSRKEGERIIINDDIVLTVVEVKGRTVKLGFEFPADATILREELYDKIKADKLLEKLAQTAPSANGSKNKLSLTFNLDE